MTDIMNNEKKEITLSWDIENYSYCCYRNDESLESPDFTADCLEGTIWYIQLYPRGKRKENKGCISIYLVRSSLQEEPENFPLKFELSFLAADGSAVTSKEFEYTYRPGMGHGCIDIHTENLGKKAYYLPEDTLKVHCKIWRGEGELKQVKQINARTCIGIEKISFLHVIEGFSDLAPEQKHTIDIRSASEDEWNLSSSVYFSDDFCSDGKIMVEISPSNSEQILSLCRLYLLDASGNALKCGEADNRSDADRRDIRKIPLSLTRQLIMIKQTEFLPGDKFSLLFDCVFSIGEHFSKIERIIYEIPFEALNKFENDDNDNVGSYNPAEKLTICSSALNDLKSAYNNQLLTDMKVETKTGSFEAHKLVLCARSPVFKNLITNDIKRKNNKCIQVDGLEDDTIQRLLSFFYTDNLENLQWESALKLFFAAVKFEVERLKMMCSSFLVDNLTASTASELLLLADTHSDVGLQKAVEDFIFKHEEEVFSSPEWEDLIKTNAELVSRTMLLKYKRKHFVGE